MNMKHLKGSKTNVISFYVDFSLAFNTIQPSVLIKKIISEFKLEFKIVGWLLHFLSDVMRIEYPEKRHINVINNFYYYY